MSITIDQPYPFFTELDGTALESGKIYIGTAGLDAEANPITAYWDADTTITATQPIRTIAGVPDNSGTPSSFFAKTDYSITIRDVNDVLVYSKLQVNSNELLGGAEVISKNAAYTAVSTDRSKLIRSTATMTLSLTAAATLGNGWFVDVRSDSGTLTVDPNGGETINGASTLVINVNGSARISCDGAAFYAQFLSADVLNGPLNTNSHSINESKGAAVASAAALPLGNDGNYFDITGNATITSINPVFVGAVRTLHFDDVLILTHHATDLILPNSQDITTYAGYVATFREYASGDWVFISDNAISGPLAAQQPLTLLESVEAADATTNILYLSAFDSSLYDNYVIDIPYMGTSGTSAGLRMEFSSDGGSTYFATGYYGGYYTEFVMAGGTISYGGSGTEDYISLLGTNGTGFQSYLRLSNIHDGTNDTRIIGESADFRTPYSIRKITMDAGVAAANYIKIYHLSTTDYFEQGGQVNLYGVNKF